MNRIFTSDQFWYVGVFKQGKQLQCVTLSIEEYDEKWGEKMVK